MAVPYDTQRVHMQSDGFTHHEEWDREHRKERYPLLLHYPYFEIYRKQVVKQADLVMALHLRDAFTLEEKIANFAYYEARTTRDSSLSASQQAVVAAETGTCNWPTTTGRGGADRPAEPAPQLRARPAHRRRWPAAGRWPSPGFGGLRDHNGELTFGPRLPPGSPACGSGSSTGGGS